MAVKTNPGADLRLLEPFWDEPCDRRVLPNGVRLVVKPDHSCALVSVQVWVQTGSVHEGPWLGSGISHFLEHMLFKGTARRSGPAIASEVQALGGSINAYTSFDRTVYHIDLPSEHVLAALDVLADMVQCSTFPAEEVLREREVILREIAMTRDDPDGRLGEALFAEAYKVHPHRYPVIGRQALFSRLTREDLLAYYKTRYTPSALCVIVAGDVEPGLMAGEVERLFGAAAEQPGAGVLIPAEPAQTGARALVLEEDVTVVRCGIAWKLPGFGHPDGPFLDVVAALLGGGESSILWSRVRDRKGLVHSIDAQCWMPLDTGLFSVFFTCEPDKREAALAAVHAELRRLATKGPTRAEVAKAIRQLVVAEIGTRRTMSGQAARIGEAEFAAGDLHFARAWFGRLHGLVPGDIRRVTRLHLCEAPTTQVASVPARKLPMAPNLLLRSAAEGDFELRTLSNGARIAYQVDKRLPQLHLRAALRGGPLQDPPELRGASALLATLMTRDTRKRSAAQVSSAVEAAGGFLGSFCGNNSLGVSVEVLPNEARLAVDILREACLCPVFRKSTLEIEREAQAASLRLEADDIVSLARRSLRQHFFGTYPLSVDSTGREKDLARIRAADLSGLHDGLLCAGNLVVAVAGDFDPKSLLPRIEDWLGALPKVRATAPAQVFKAGASSQHVLRLGREQAVVMDAYPGPELLSPDFHAGEVADELFSGMAARLFERVREELGLAYFVRSARVTGLGGGMFSFLAGTQPGKESLVFAEIDAEIARVASGDLGAGELSRCRARLSAGRRLAMQSCGARALNAALSVLFGLPVNDWRGYDARIAAVDEAVLARFAQKYLKPEYRVRLLAGPGS